MKGAAVYLRVSTQEQRERQTIANQYDFATGFCKLHDIAVVSWYVDDGVSGTIPFANRPEGARLLEDARAGKLDSVYVYRLDRFGRDPRLILNVVGELETMGVQLRSMTEPFDTATPAGRFLLTILSGVAGLERDTIVERSKAGSDRLAREGVWLGGICPYGYRVVGKGREARLAISDEPVLDLGISEADVVRLVYHSAVEEGLSCIVIADRLNQLGVPTIYTRDGRQLSRGKRKVATAGVWSPGRVRSMLVGTVYRGVHTYGKRATKPREVFERKVPAIVSSDTWDRAQLVLRQNRRFAQRNTRRKYLLRGLIKCALCGFTYVGTSYTDSKGEKTYYACNGKMGNRLYLLHGKRCPSKSLSGSTIEQSVWQDVEQFILSPDDVVAELQENASQDTDLVVQSQPRMDELNELISQKGKERDLVIGLFRRGRITTDALDKQLDEIAREEEELNGRLGQVVLQVNDMEAAGARALYAGDFLRKLQPKLASPPEWSTKRKLVETLVEGIVVETVEQDGRPQGRVVVTYKFTELPAIMTVSGAHAGIMETR